MIDEGRKRFGNTEHLMLECGDIRDFTYNIPPADFCFVSDLGHLHTIEDVTAAFRSIGRHLRVGGGLVVESGLPYRKSTYSPPQEFRPLKQVYPGLKVWKVGETKNDAETGRCYISQTVCIEDETGAVEEFDHSFYLQSYERDALIKALIGTGFEIRHEYRSREKEPWREDDGLWIAETVKVREAEGGNNAK
jgi:SAM-dependent methyltransferase